jgi:hypothetical protein
MLLEYLFLHSPFKNLSKILFSHDKVEIISMTLIHYSDLHKHPIETKSPIAENHVFPSKTHLNESHVLWFHFELHFLCLEKNEETHFTHKLQMQFILFSK